MLGDNPISRNDIPGRKAFIQGLIAQAKIQSALKSLMDFTEELNENLRKEAILLSFQFNQLKQMERISKITPQEEMQQLNVIVFRALEFLDELCDSSSNEYYL